MKKILNLPIWLHVILTIITSFLWLIVVAIAYFTKDKEVANATIDNNKKEPVEAIYFNVAGITFENRQNIIQDIINDAKETMSIDLYDGMTSKEILECGYEVYEISDLKLSSIRLNPTEYKNQDAVEIYITDFNKKEHMIGYVPKDKVEEVLDFMENIEKHPEYTLKADAYITGGKYKNAEYDLEKDKDVLITDKRNYGINIKLELFE